MAYDKNRDKSWAEAGATVPAKRAVVIAPHDANDLLEYPKALRINVGGTLKIIPSKNADADAVTITVAAGEILPIQVRRVFATGTTATGILALLG